VKKAKPFTIAKQLVWEAWQRVKANQGAPGIDDETIAAFEVNLKDNLYRLWNRMSSGSYFPPPVKVVEIPKKSGGQRRLGVPTVSDRLAQMVVKLTLEPVLEPLFHRDSYGYRPGKSALAAIGITRERCWRYDWLLEFDIRAAFDSIDHSLLLKALKKHTDCPWILLYVERWLTVPFQYSDGRVEPRTAGLPQGGVLSPLLMNLFLHYTLDHWLQTHYPQHPFARYADDAVVHCKTEHEAHALRAALTIRLAACKLTLHPEKTRVIYCRDANRTERRPQDHFEFLGYQFRPRTAQNRQGQLFLSFAPAMSPTALKKIRQEIRFNWHLQRRVDKSLDDLAQMFNPKIRGWYTYYGAYHRSALARLAKSLNNALVKWVMHKYMRFKGHKRRAREWLAAVAHRAPGLFAHWEGGKAFAPAGR
jgi:RNA-directed DNA polymerase